MSMLPAEQVHLDEFCNTETGKQYMSKLKELLHSPEVTCKIKENNWREGKEFYFTMPIADDLRHRRHDDSLPLQRPKYVAHFGLVFMPNCEDVLISSDANVDYELQGKGIGTLLHGFKLDFLRWFAKELRKRETYRSAWPLLPNTLICTVNNSNDHEISILNKYNWVCSLPGEKCSLWTLKL